MSREIVLRVRVDDPTDEMLSAAAKFNNVPKAQMALDFLISGLEQYMGALPKNIGERWAQDAPRQAA